MANSKKTISMTIDKDLISKVDTICKDAERQRSWFISRAIKNYLEELEDVDIALERLKAKETRMSEDQLRKKLGI